MNEIIFILHASIISSFTLGSLKLGKEALIAFICLQSILANLFISKQITLFGLTATCTDAFIIGAMLGLQLLQEYFGRTITKKTIWINFFLLIFYTIISQFQIFYAPNSDDIAHIHYWAILSLMPRITIASLTVYFIVQQIDYRLYGLLKRILHERFFILRSYITVIICQLLDTILFSFLGLYGIITDIKGIILISFAIKMSVVLISTPFLALSKKII
jgi:uncharacterized integral membrane protein (TIGR00697 family)